MSQTQIETVSDFNPCKVHLLKENNESSEVKSSDRQPSPANQLLYPVVGGTQVNSRAILLGASSVSSAAR